MPAHPPHLFAVTTGTEPPSPGATSTTEAACLTVSVDEAAALLGVNRKTLYASIQKGEVPGVLRLGRVIRIGRAALVAWASGKASPAQE